MVELTFRDKWCIYRKALAEAKKREAQYTEFKARQSFEDLEKELAKLN